MLPAKSKAALYHSITGALHNPPPRSSCQKSGNSRRTGALTFVKK